MTMSDVMQAFARAWNTDDDAGRLRLLTTACVPGVVLVVPQGTLTGIGCPECRHQGVPPGVPGSGGDLRPPDKRGGFLRVAWVTRWNTGQPRLGRRGLR